MPREHPAGSDGVSRCPRWLSTRFRGSHPRFIGFTQWFVAAGVRQRIAATTDDIPKNREHNVKKRVEKGSDCRRKRREREGDRPD